MRYIVLTLAVLATAAFTIVSTKDATAKEIDCGVEHSRFNPTELSERQLCLIDKLYADEESGTIGSFIWTRVGEEIVAVPMRTLRSAGSEDAAKSIFVSSIVDATNGQLSAANAQVVTLEADVAKLEKKLNNRKKAIRETKKSIRAAAQGRVSNGPLIDMANDLIDMYKNDVATLTSRYNNAVTMLNAARTRYDMVVQSVTDNLNLSDNQILAISTGGTIQGVVTVTQSEIDNYASTVVRTATPIQYKPSGQVRTADIHTIANQAATIAAGGNEHHVFHFVQGNKLYQASVKAIEIVYTKALEDAYTLQDVKNAWAEGFKDGYEEGYADGYRDGYVDGFRDGVNSVQL